MGAGVDVTIPLLRRHLNESLTYLHPYLPYLNAHMTKFFSEGLWQRNVPANIQSEICTETDAHEAINIYRQHLYPTVNGADSDRFKNFRTFLLNAKKFYLESYTDVWVTPNELNRKLKLGICDEVQRRGVFMPKKKKHEVEAVANVIANICAMNKDNGKFGVIDAGDGKGYLSSHLSLAYGIKVLGIDSKCSLTSAASARYSELLKELRRKRKKSVGTTDEAVQPQLPFTENYRMATHYITPQTDFLDIFSNEFSEPKEDIPGLCLTGLHTCGDLASTCLKIYCENHQISAICNIGCCYHKNSQRYNDTHQFNYNPALDHHRPLVGYGFPLSRYLNEKRIGFDVTARQISVISVHRTVNLTDDAVRYRCLFQRALLELLIQRRCPQFCGTTITGRIRLAKFTDYIRKANDRNGHLNFDDQHISNEKLDELYDEFRKFFPFLILYNLMRDSLGSALETIFLLDRLLYLKENQHRASDVSFLVKFFDSVESPRCYGLVAIKNVVGS